MELDGRVAIVTGGSRGIGKQIALALAREGAAVVVAARTEREGEHRLPGTIHQTVREIEDAGGRAVAVRTDLTVDGDVEQMVQRTLAEFGRVDILVHNAAANFNSLVVDLPVKRWDLMMRVNLRAAFLCARAVLPTMIARRRGSIICMSSVAAQRKAPRGEVCYSITKAGIELFCWGLAQEVAEYNIAVNALYPQGAVLTDGFKLVFKDVKLDDGLLARMKRPEEIAEAVLWLARQDAATITGRSVSDDEVRAFIEGKARP